MTGSGQKDIPAYTLKRSRRKSLGLTIERDGVIIVRAPFSLTQEDMDRAFFILEKVIVCDIWKARMVPV